MNNIKTKLYYPIIKAPIWCETVKTRPLDPLEQLILIYLNFDKIPQYKNLLDFFLEEFGWDDKFKIFLKEIFKSLIFNNEINLSKDSYADLNDLDDLLRSDIEVNPFVKKEFESKNFVGFANNKSEENLNFFCFNLFKEISSKNLLLKDYENVLLRDELRKENEIYEFIVNKATEKIQDDMDNIIDLYIDKLLRINNSIGSIFKNVKPYSSNKLSSKIEIYKECLEVEWKIIKSSKKIELVNKITLNYPEILVRELNDFFKASINGKSVLNIPKSDSYFLDELFENDSDYFPYRNLNNELVYIKENNNFIYVVNIFLDKYTWKDFEIEVPFFSLIKTKLEDIYNECNGVSLYNWLNFNKLSYIHLLLKDENLEKWTNFLKEHTNDIVSYLLTSELQIYKDLFINNKQLNLNYLNKDHLDELLNIVDIDYINIFNLQDAKDSEILKLILNYYLSRNSISDLVYSFLKYKDNPKSNYLNLLINFLKKYEEFDQAIISSISEEDLYIFEEKLEKINVNWREISTLFNCKDANRIESWLSEKSRQIDNEKDKYINNLTSSIYKLNVELPKKFEIVLNKPKDMDLLEVINNKVTDKKLNKECHEWRKFRNNIVHQQGIVDKTKNVKRLKEFLEKLKDFEKFINVLEKYLIQMEKK